MSDDLKGPRDPVEEKAAAIRARMASRTNREEERQILAILEASSSAELDKILAGLDIRTLVSALDNRVVGPDHRSALFQLLTVDRLDDLSIATRAALIAALQRGHTGAADEAAIRNIFLGTKGAALRELKAMMDRGGDYRDLHQLLFHDIDSAAVRAEILDHFSREAAAAAGEVKILSDIDDTFYANWKDTRFPKKTIYPGVLQLYSELDRGPSESPGRTGDVTFVTARPGDRLGLVERATHKALMGRGLPASTVLAGAFTRVFSNRSIAGKKLDNFREYWRIYQECSFIFIGDSGQGDIFFGEQMLEVAPAAVKGIFIHDVVSTPEAAREDLRRRGVILFDTYVGAALEAYRRGLLQRQGMARVAAVAMTELNAILFQSEAQRQERLTELARDIERLNVELLPDERISFP
jgi:hypothetical protein